MELSYKIYPTLLDAFNWYLKSDDDEGVELQKLIDKINRVPFTSEAAEKGTAFNDLIDQLIEGNRTGTIDVHSWLDQWGNKLKHNGFDFKPEVAREFYEKLKLSHTQVFVKATVATKYGLVELYGYIDNVLFGSPTDIKCTGSYDFPKYLHNWQHIIYPYCLIHGEDAVDPMVASDFKYEVTNYTATYTEQYIYKEERDLPRLVTFIERFIEFLMLQKEKITDQKIFAKDVRREEVPVAG